jgi:TetR/AcrR family transcriptional repressor of nem operon
MARPREFDIDEVLEAAMQTFWHRGYEATSMTDLMAATGLQKGSIYKAFQDKHTLFMAALGRYLDESYRLQRKAIEQAESPREGLKILLSQLIGLATAAEGRCRGCFVVNSLVELGPHDDSVVERIDQHVSRTRQLLIDTIERGQVQGELRNDVDATQLGHWLMVFITGLLASMKSSMTTDSAMQLAGLTLHLLE